MRARWKALAVAGSFLILAGVTAARIDVDRFRRGTSVGDGRGGPPGLSAEVMRAAAGAGCKATSEASRGRGHTTGAIAYVDPIPVSGPHDPVWASWGIYDRPVPFRYQVHNLEHGGITIHLGPDLGPAARADLRAEWGRSPEYMLLVPASRPGVPKGGIVVTAWQRRLVCGKVTPSALRAARVFRDAYRGRGPEGVDAFNHADPHDAASLPAPALADKGAE
jgi:hypothetical protein